MCDISVNTCSFIFNSVLGWFKTQEIYDRVVSKDSFMQRYCPDRYKTQKMCEEAVDDCLAQ